ncbi:outer membrane beta-barrel protein [Robbsia sp. Bb-Pol-6]|uniref:Outer membrane beta-barrel protein n=1 Tax=Robbsia betulipollinis TaxID=2981849 RepID=A0ABT3ZP56_9BURK|nr:OmpW family outer membrane protein [Robbsia betulipollinis]MCY0388333.1 outer membrane beta-barrel protein [Robbsia betulipollinis]
MHQAVRNESSRAAEPPPRIPFVLQGAVAGVLFCAAGAAHAQAAGSVVLSTGWMHVAPQVSTDPMHSTIGLGGGSFPRTDKKISSQVGAANTLGLTVTYFVTDHIAAELAAGVPPRFRINGAGSIESYGQLGSARMWSPAVLLKYYFRPATAAFRPYVGLGASYVWFTDGKITNDAFRRQRLGGDTEVSVSKGLSPVFNVGMSYAFASNWYAGVSVSYLPMRRTLTLTTPRAATPFGTASVKSEVRTQLNPIVAYLSIGYRF